MKFSKAEQAALVDDLRAIAARLAGAPAHTEERAKANDKAHPAHCGHWPHQVGGLETICSSSARDIEAIIRRLGGGS